MSVSSILRIEGEAMSINSKRTMTDTSGKPLIFLTVFFVPKNVICDLPGKEVAGYRKKLLSLHATAYVTVELNGEHCYITI